MAIGPPSVPTSPGPLPAPPLPIAPPTLPSPPAMPPTPLNVFPSTPSISWSVIKSPNWSTDIQRSVSGKELRSSNYVLPIYTLTLTYERLLDKWDIRMGAGVGSAYKPGFPAFDELRTVWEFFNQQIGADVPFMFNDLSDNTTRLNPMVTNTIFFGVGDGATNQFQMASALKAVVIPFLVNSITPAYGYTINPNNGVLTLATPPTSGMMVGADMEYYYRVRFANDGLSAENFAYQFWNLRTLKLVTAID